jgi:hypothetical protein
MLAPPSVESSNLSGDTQDIFQPGESVFAKGSGYIPNTRYDLCVVNDTTWTNDMFIPSRVMDTATYVITDSNGNISYSYLSSSCGPPALIWTSSVVGTYDIVVDVNHNQKYDKGTDVLDDMDVDGSAGFETVPEFSTIAIPVASILGLLFFFNLRKRRKG